MPKITDTKERLIKAGVKLAGKIGTSNITRRSLAEAAGIKEPLVTYHVGTVADMRKMLKREAKKQGVVEPDKAKQEAIGVKLRAHGPRATKSKKPAPVKKAAVKVSKAVVAKKPSRSKPVVAPLNSELPAAEVVQDNKLAAEVQHHAEAAHTAARAPKAPPIPVPQA